MKKNHVITFVIVNPETGRIFADVKMSIASRFVFYPAPMKIMGEDAFGKIVGFRTEPIYEGEKVMERFEHPRAGRRAHIKPKDQSHE